MHDESFRGALDQVALRGVGCNDVAHGVRNAALQRQSNSRERMPQGFAPLALPAVAIRSKFVLQQFADIGQNRPGD